MEKTIEFDPKELRFLSPDNEHQSDFMQQSHNLENLVDGVLLYPKNLAKYVENIENEIVDWIESTMKAEFETLEVTENGTFKAEDGTKYKAFYFNFISYNIFGLPTEF